MATELLAIGTATAASSDLVVAAGSPVTVCLKSAAGPNLPRGARVDIQLKDNSNQYFTVELLSAKSPAQVIVGPGTYRFWRPEGPSCGVFSG